jgi:hypothetical protein
VQIGAVIAVKQRDERIARLLATPAHSAPAGPAIEEREVAQQTIFGWSTFPLFQDRRIVDAFGFIRGFACFKIVASCHGDDAMIDEFRFIFNRFDEPTILCRG